MVDLSNNYCIFAPHIFLKVTFKPSFPHFAWEWSLCFC